MSYAMTILLAALASAPADASTNGERYEIAYHHVLRNHTKQPLRDVRVYLTVPPSDGYQSIGGFRVETFGHDVHISNRRDEFGNALKRVVIPEIAAGAEVRVGFSCEAVLRPPTVARFDSPPKKSYADVDPELIKTFTRNHSIFDLESPVIRAKAAELLRDYPEPAARAVAIHHFIAGSFKYKRGDGWHSAPAVLERRSGSCSEFTYVFCALCRATGIPTRMVGASMFPAKKRMPFVDRVWHRWPEAYLPDQGWVAFDPTLDRRRKNPLFVGTHHGRTLILTRKGDRSTQLGLSYLPSNSHSRQIKRSRYFVWSQGTRRKLEEAQAKLQAGENKKAAALLKRIVRTHGETRTGIEAAQILREMDEEK